MNRRVFILEAGKAVPAVVGALYIVSCGDNTVTPSATAEIQSTSTVSNGHSHTVGVPASDQMKTVATPNKSAKWDFFISNQESRKAGKESGNQEQDSHG